MRILSKGDTLQTEHFGLYREKYDTDLPTGETIGILRVKELNGYAACFLYESTADGTMRYDMPAWTVRYVNRKIAVLGRHWDKIVDGKTYHKIVVIGLREVK